MLAERAYVITLDREPARLEAFKKRWEAVGAPLPLTVLLAVDGALLDPLPQWGQVGTRGRGRYESHMRLLATTPVPSLILEDDAVFAADFVASLESPAPEEWDVIHLGGQDRWRETEPERAGIFRSPGVVRTHGYVARRPPAVARVLAAHLHEGRAIDDVLCEAGLERYSATPFTVGQAAGAGDRFQDEYWNPTWMMLSHEWRTST